MSLSNEILSLLLNKCVTRIKYFCTKSSEALKQHVMLSQESVTWTAIARLRSDAGHEHKGVMTAYQRALSLAKMAENEKQEFLVYQQICNYCDNHGYHEKAKHARREMEKLHHVDTSINSDSSSSEDDTSDVTLSSSEEGLSSLKIELMCVSNKLTCL